MKLQITIDGQAYAVEVEVLEEDDTQFQPASAQEYSSQPATAPVAIQNYGGAWDADAKLCRSPVMGLAITVNVKSGQAVKAGELLMVLEAMKMETNITAPRAATVRQVHVTPGGAVKLDQPLLELE